MDTVSKEVRSKNMSAIRSKDTIPELIVRKVLFGMGYRYRLHAKSLPGKPDIVLKKYRTVIFIHGCYWHHHANCKRANWPKSNKEYWIPKIKRNIARDKIHQKNLKKMGWSVIIFWECEVKDIKYVKKIVLQKLNQGM